MANTGVVLHPRWTAWILENLADGAPASTVIDALIGEGLARELVEPAVTALADDPALPGVVVLVGRLRALEEIVRLRHHHRAARPEGSTTIERMPLPSPARFIAEHWVPGVPAIFTDVVTRWPLDQWTPERLAQRLGDVVVEACVGRTGVSAPDPEWQPLRREMPLRELLGRVITDADGDVYMLAKNNAMQRPGLAPLLAEIQLPPPLFAGDVDPRRTALWIGPAGTHTALHHDHDNSLFCQAYGRKRVRMAPPESLPLLGLAHGVYSRWDPRGDHLAGAPEALVEVVVDAGEALFIPAGWWHQVDALTASVTVTALGFALANDYGWYRPGAALRGG